MEQRSSSASLDFGHARMNSASLGDDSASWARVSGIELRSDSASRMCNLASHMMMSLDSASWKNNSASLMKIVVDSASLFLDSASLVVEPQLLLVKALD